MADIFTPSKGGDVENFTGRSQGGTPHRAQEFTATGTTVDPLNTLLEGAGKLFFSGVSGMDNLIKEDIKEQILVDVDAAQSANGLGEFNRRADFLNSETDSLPDIDREISSLERLKKAKESGAFNERSYYTQLLATSRRLRNQYPSYRAEIDAKMQSLSGVDPANAILRMIDGEQKAAAAAARAKANDQEKFLLNNAKYAYGLPDTMSISDKISIINRRKQGEHLIELETKAASLRDKNQEEAREQIFASAAKRLAIQSDNDRTVVLSAMGLPIAEAEKKWQDMLNQGTMTPEIEQGLRGLETQLRVELPRRIEEIQAFANQNNLSPAQTSALIDQASFRHKALIQSLERKDLRPLAIAETALKIEEINDRNVVRAVEGVRVQAALGRELSPETMKVYSSQPNAMSATGRIATEVASLSLLNKTPVSAAMKEIERRSEGKATEEDILHPIRANVQTLGAEDPKVAAKAAATLYQVGNNNMMATIPGNRVDIYQQVFGVKAQKDVEKIGDPVLIKHMAASAIANAKDVIAKSVRTVMAANENTLDQQYVYDINTGQIRDIGKVVLSPLEEFSTYQRASSAIAGQAARNELANINATFSVLRPLVEKTGLDWNNVVLDLFKASGADPYRPAEPWRTPGQWFSQLSTAVINALRPGRDTEFPGFSGGGGSDEVGGGEGKDRLSSMSPEAEESLQRLIDAGLLKVDEKDQARRRGYNQEYREVTDMLDKKLLETFLMIQENVDGTQSDVIESNLELIQELRKQVRDLDNIRSEIFKNGY